MFPRDGDDDGHFFCTSSHGWDGTIDMKRIHYEKKYIPHPSKYIKRCLYLEEEEEEEDDNNNTTTNKPTGLVLLLLLLLLVHKKKGKWKSLNLFVCGCGFC
jgi:hypothetical protein